MSRATLKRLREAAIQRIWSQCVAAIEAATGKRCAWRRTHRDKREDVLHRVAAEAGVRPATAIDAELLRAGASFTPRPATRPCDSPTGSLRRVAAYALRVRRGEELWHEDDADGPAVEVASRYPTSGVAVCR